MAWLKEVVREVLYGISMLVTVVLILVCIIISAYLLLNNDCPNGWRLAWEKDVLTYQCINNVEAGGDNHKTDSSKASNDVGWKTSIEWDGSPDHRWSD